MRELQWGGRFFFFGKERSNCINWQRLSSAPLSDSQLWQFKLQQRPFSIAGEADAVFTAGQGDFGMRIKKTSIIQGRKCISLKQPDAVPWFFLCLHCIQNCAQNSAHDPTGQPIATEGRG